MLAISLSALFASCNNEIEEEADPLSGKNDKRVMSFSTYTGGATRASEVTQQIIQGTKDNPGTGFKVSARYGNLLYFNDEVLNGTGTQDGVEAGVDGTYDTQTDTYYWPLLSTTNKMYFRAFNNMGDGASWADNDYKTIQFAVKPTAAEQKDLVVAYAEATSVPDNGVQPLEFAHALSRINFSFTGVDEDYTYVVNKVEIIAAGNEADKSAVMEFPLTSTSWSNFTPITTADKSNPLVKGNDDKSGSVPNQGVLYTYFDSQNDATKDISFKGSETKALNESFMLLPQSGKIAIRVYYKVMDDKDKLAGNCGYSKTDKKGKHEGDTGYDPSNGAIYGCKTVVVSLGEGTALAWEAGKAYRYTLALPTANFSGDADGDGVADDLYEGKDLDGDGDGEESEFGMDNDQYIEFSVKVSLWNDIKENDANIIIK